MGEMNPDYCKATFVTSCRSDDLTVRLCYAPARSNGYCGKHDPVKMIKCREGQIVKLRTRIERALSEIKELERKL